MNAPARPPRAMLAALPGAGGSRLGRLAREIGYGRVAGTAIMVLLALVLARGFPVKPGAARVCSLRRAWLVG